MRYIVFVITEPKKIKALPGALTLTPGKAGNSSSSRPQICRVPGSRHPAKKLLQKKSLSGKHLAKKIWRKIFLKIFAGCL